MAKEPAEDLKFNTSPITRKKLSDQVFDRLWEMIASGELPPGSTIPSERILMEKFGVGRPAVREALQTLSNKGLITISQGERTRVNKLSAEVALDQVDEIAKLLLSSQPSSLEHLKQIRKIIEAGTSRIAAERCTTTDVQDLRKLIAKQRDCVPEAARFIQADIEFHVAIATIASNPMLKAITRAMLNWLVEHYQPLLRWPGRESTTLLEHERLVDYLEAHDADGTARMMREHLDRSDPLFTLGGS